MVAPAVEGIDLFKIANRSISGWIPSFKAGPASHPALADIASSVREVWPWGDVASPNNGRPIW
jgi:hypothetical protein